MNSWPNWIPKPNAWLSAVLLILLVRGLAIFLRIIIETGHSLFDLSPKMKILLWFVALLSPILTIAVAHHFLHRFLDRYFPNSRSPEMTVNEGFIPSLMSWWEGLYGWMTINLAFLISYIVQIIFSSSFDSLYGMLYWWDELRDLFTLPTLYRLITTAYLYQFEYLVRHHLMNVGSTNQ